MRMSQQLFIGGRVDGQRLPVADDQDRVDMPSVKPGPVVRCPEDPGNAMPEKILLDRIQYVRRNLTANTTVFVLDGICELKMLEMLAEGYRRQG